MYPSAANGALVGTDGEPEEWRRSGESEGEVVRMR